MYFKRLELVGFKSFSEKTVLNFEPGVTAVVGPNGCGKSNIFDSIRWVLGEQSVKAMRGADMQDVIFNGTDNKEPLSMAEVSVVFDNANRFFSVDHDEVMITRRLFRSGDSEYLLNKTQVRLKDIMDILLGTGIGAESYSLIQQGKIDLVLSSRPEDRRLVFDEASGITKYKAQKKEAIRKLDETQQNLLRVNDIVIEVKRQIGSLERQASKARRYKEVFEELKEKEIKISCLQKDTLLKKREELGLSLADNEAREKEVAASVQQLESEISLHKDKINQCQQQISLIKDQIMQEENKRSADSQHILFNKERIAELVEQVAYLNSQSAQLSARIEHDQQEFDKLNQEFASLSKNIEEKKNLLSENERQLEEINNKTRVSLELIAQSKKDILDVAAGIAHLKNSVHELTSKQHVFLARKKRLDIENAKVTEEKNTALAQMENTRVQVEQLQQEFALLSEKISAVKKQMDEESCSIKNMDAEIEDLEKQSLSLFSHKEFLEKLRSEYDVIGESMNATIYLDKLPQDKLGGLVIKLNAYPQLNPENNYISESNGTFKLLGEAKPVDLNTEKIKEKIEQIQHKLDSLQMIKRMKEAHISDLGRDADLWQESLRSSEISLANKKALFDNIASQVDKIRSEEEVILLELSDVQQQLSGFDAGIVKLQQDLACAENKQKECEELITTEQNNISLRSKAREDFLVVIAQTKTELTALEKRLNTDQDTLRLLDENCQKNKNALLGLEKQVLDNQARKQNLEKEVIDLQQAVSIAVENITLKQADFTQAQEKYDLCLKDADVLTNRLGEARKCMEDLRGVLYDLQMRNKDLEFKYLNIKERVLQAYKVDLEALSMPAQEDSPEAEETLSACIDQLKKKVDSYGTVNLVAIEEYDELKKRYDFLAQQQLDLDTARQALHDAINKINRTTKKMFVETFELVKVQFRNYFRLLFNGGDAQLFLVDENDPLESGIEIICRPPGKKLQNVLLLSGGEKSMAAIALIFAIFKVKPAPFCILDEIDAALDEANVDRFGRMLQEFAKGSQFIIITHNKKTIANANVMYGITMEQSGVSKIVSVKFSQQANSDGSGMSSVKTSVQPEPV
ncbi:MAG: AAA family ATPase [Candidatus Omnitrophica bacterium]|jgi:chromosome segregation protein|nr:AAA family ATPase [Candidatus Omnitrophota bacterium]